MNGYLNDKYFAFDLETIGLHKRGKLPEILSYSLATSEGAYSFPWDADTVKATFERYLKEGYTPIFHNAAFDVPILRGEGIAIPRYHDTMIMFYVLSTAGSNSLEALGELVSVQKHKKPWIGSHPTEVTMELLAYGMRDVETTLAGFNYLKDLLMGDSAAWNLYSLIELPYCEVIQEMEAVGLCYDVSAAQELATSLGGMIDSLKKQITEMFPTAPGKIITYKTKHEESDVLRYLGSTVEEGKEVFKYQTIVKFNPASGSHVAYALQQQGWKPNKKTAKGKVCVAADVLENLDYPLSKLVTQHADISKMLNTFVSPLAEFSDDNRMIHGSYNQCRTITGRLSSSAPNMQNLPRQGELGKKIREMFVTPNKQIQLFNGDLGNIEPRIVAFYAYMLCGDMKMAQTFIDGKDFHAVNAEDWRVERQDAKVIFLSIIYGQGLTATALKIKRSLQETKKLYALVDESCPQLNNLVEATREHARKNGGLVHTLLGRRLCYPDITSSESALRSRAERQVFNALIQGSSSDVLKYLTVKSVPTVRKYKGVISGAVHDELLGYAPTEYSEAITAELTALWESDTIISPVPIIAKFKFGNSWSETH